MMDLASILSLAEVGAQGTFSSLSSFLSGLNLEAGELSTGGLAVALAAVWYFVRIIRLVVSILFTICLLLLAFQLTGHVDFSAVWEAVSAWLGSGTPATPAP